LSELITSLVTVENPNWAFVVDLVGHIPKQISRGLETLIPTFGCLSSVVSSSFCDCIIVPKPSERT
jgi:hypothetical protein